MPAKQRGQTVKRGSSWAVRYYDEQNVRRFCSGFATKTDAREWVDRKVDEIEKVRNGNARLRLRFRP